MIQATDSSAEAASDDAQTGVGSAAGLEEDRALLEKMISNETEREEIRAIMEGDDEGEDDALVELGVRLDVEEEDNEKLGESTVSFQNLGNSFRADSDCILSLFPIAEFDGGQVDRWRYDTIQSGKRPGAISTNKHCFKMINVSPFSHRLDGD
jgi:hypothetical protein